MGPLQRQDNSQPATQAFLRWINRRHAVPDTPASADLQDFIPSGNVVEYLNHSNHLRNILSEIFPRHKDRPKPETILRNYCRVFAILVAVGSAELIRECALYDELKDEKLPFTNRPTSFPRDTHDDSSGAQETNNDVLFVKFKKWQPYFCAPKIETRHGHRLDTDSILPYIEKSQIGEGGSSIVYRVKLHSQHDGLRANHDALCAHDDHRQYALKVYQGPDSRRYHDDESLAFRSFGSSGLEKTGLVGYYGSYAYNNEHHLLLELADLGDIEKIVMKESPPSIDSEIIAFWENLFAIMDALVKIHDNKGVNYENEPFPRMMGVHQDIKMSNVLVKRRSNTSDLCEAAFGLADLGTSRYEEHAGGGKTMENYGTKTYGAPECYRGDTLDDSRRFPITSAADIFSVGCLFSELCVWIFGGFEGRHGLKEYRKQRILEHGDEVRGQDSFHRRGQFSREILPIVSAEHTKLLHQTRCDSTTKAVINLLPEMLAIEPEDRPSATNLRRRLKDLIVKAKASLEGAQPISPIAKPPNGLGSSVPASPTPMDRAARVMTQPVVSQPAISRGRTDSHSIYAQNGGPRTVVDSPDAMTPAGSHAHAGSNDTGVLLDSVTKNLATSRLDRRLQLDRKSHSLRNRAPTTQSIAHSSNRRGTIPASSSRTTRPEHRSVSTAPGSLPTADTDSTSSDHDEMSGPDAHLVDQTDTAAGSDPLPRHHARHSSEQSRFVGRPINDPSNSVFGRPNQSQGTSPISGATETGPPARTPPGPPAPTVQSAVPSPGLAPHSPTTPPTTQATARTRTQSKTPAFLNYDTAAAYMDCKKRKERCKPLPGSESFELQLEGRDHVFVMDNSKSMYDVYDEDKRLQRKPDVRALVRLLAWLTKSTDPNGVDLHYFSAARKLQTESLTKCKRSRELENSLRQAKCTEQTTPNLVVGKLLDAYRQRLVDHRESLRGTLSRYYAKLHAPRPLSLYIFTDGVWETPAHKGGEYLETEITMLVKELVEAGLPRQQVGIQFIRFGNHEFGKQRLDHLDRLNKELNLGLDIVDTEPVTRGDSATVEGGNIWKMLLGAINANFDDDEEEQEIESSQGSAIPSGAASTR